ncbi:ectoine utilization protein EutC [Acuticoccus sp. I52.16.1]|uniref:ectoine utilization protein EutC n=1 Tax=Acuticoccus sp. I52.16.1 TaxID=2928472 RepID=UPI001FD39151|nr:ectoine utilization protein EutC [Acuticoccus sp. I52.16.1]UOM32729.1 ectoine utilization protein EutC [Acuticoccus sp. I52.16.1]
MPTVTLLGRTELRRLVPLDLAAVDCVENAFATLARGGVEMPPILSMAIAEHNGEIDVKTAYVPGLPTFAVKMSPGFFDNPAKGLPSTSGLMVVFSSETGMVRAMLIDNGYLTDVRTAAAGAVAARHLARADAATVAILGTGLQAELQLKALTLVRPITRVRIWGRSRDKAETLAEAAGSLGLIRTEAVPSPQDAVRGADIVVTTTPATEPLLMADWLEPGQHVTAMGSDQHHKCEIDPRVLARVTYVPDRLAQTRLLGELRSAIAAGIVDAHATFAELGDVVVGNAPGRRSDDEITLADLTGTGVQDTAIATLALERATAASAGTPFVT